MNCPEALAELGTAPTALALCWEPSLAQLRRLRAGRLVVAARPWRHDWPAPLGLRWAARSEEQLCSELRAAGFELAGLKICSYSVEVSLQQWLRVLAPLCSEEDRGRFEQEMTSDDGSEPFLQFEDRLLLMVAEASSWCARRAKRPRLEAPLCLARRMALDGFWAPQAVLDASAAAEALAKLDQHAERVMGVGSRAEHLQNEQRFKLHLLYPWAAELVKHPVILEAVRQALGTYDVLCWFSEVNAKAPGSPCHAAPHQDGIYASLVPNDAVVTVWLALTDALAEMGGLFFQRGSHLRGPMPHVVDVSPQNLIGFRCLEEDEESTPVELRAGEASLHGFRTLHWSGPNLTASRRVGLALRYCRGDVRRSRLLPQRESAMLVSGSYTAGAFDLERAPSEAYGEGERKQHADALARERENYCADAVDI